MDFIESAESMLNVTDQIAENLKRVRERITAACTRSGRSSNEITLVAVTKYAELEWVRSLVELGVHDLGESRPQQLVSRSRLLPAEIRWHQIGHVQRNKVEMLLPIVTLFHSIDSVRLVESL
ncbi:MAG: YggS family pyridoxal phosphate-dependent enzyme, partial [Planctomycetes bacterium]|nr:YggS family pyridoxal phosphate-dependent enzyme [Planctomycetota bacterium]